MKEIILKCSALKSSFAGCLLSRTRPDVDVRIKEVSETHVPCLKLLSLGPILPHLRVCRHTKAAPNGKCCDDYIVPSMVRLMYQLKVCWNKGRLCWKIAKLFYFCHLKKLVMPETFGPYYVVTIRTDKKDIHSGEERKNEWMKGRKKKEWQDSLA